MAKRQPKPSPRDAATLKALADPLRLRMGLLLASGPCTVKELATELGVPPTRLYYHVRILEQQKLVRVASRRLVSGIEERRYALVEDGWNLDPDLPASSMRGVMGPLLAAVAAEVEVALEQRPDQALSEPDSAVPLSTLTELELSADEVVDLTKRLQAIVEGFVVGRKRPPPDAQRLRLLLVGYHPPGGGRAPRD